MAETWKSGVMGELDPLIGRTISGRYRVHALLGQGGMGKVFQAQQIPLGRAVALKVLSAEYEGGEDPEFHKRFFREAAILARLKSPHTVTVFDYGRDGETYYIAMELVTGEPIDRVLEMQGPMQPARALGIAQQVCRSLREAHAQGIIHRDLKPGNVLISHSDDGEEIVKVLDFGLATRMAAHDDTNPNLVPGSPKYMPPEAIRQGAVDGRADIYSLGVMLYQMLSGVVPFDRPNPMDILVAHLRENPRSLREANPQASVPEAFERLVMRCLAKNPDERFASMQEVIDALRSLAVQIDPRAETTLTGEPSVFPPGGEPSGPQLRLKPGDVTPSSGRARNRFTGVQVFAAVAALTAAGAAAAFWLTRPAHDPPPVPDEPATADPAPQPTAPEPAAPDEGPDMVFSEAELAAQERETPEPDVPTEPIEVSVTSVPSEANLIFRGKIIGVTPTTFEYDPARQPKGRPLMMRLEKEGFETKYVRRDLVPGETEVSISEYLVPSPDAPPPEPEPEEETPSPEPEPEPASQDEAEPFMKVTPSGAENRDRQAEGEEGDQGTEAP